MIEPTEKDVDRAVLYGDERGVITSFDEKYVFVRYADDLGSKATRREDLRWACEGFTRPLCQPCPHEPVRLVLVDTVEGVKDSRLCAICTGRLLPPLEICRGWP
jgi:hypothetical protein